MSGDPAYWDRICRAYWGHCGCDLPRGHAGPHVGLHWSQDGLEITTTHVIAQDYPHLFGEDVPDVADAH